MTRILILGAAGGLARHTTPFLLRQPGVQLTLYLRRASRLTSPDPARVRITEGDVLDDAALHAAMQGQDVVYANLSGSDMAAQARAIARAMQTAGVKRLIFISSMGIYGEVPGEKYRSVLDPYRDSAAVIEASGLDYTVLRPGWFTRTPGKQVQLTHKGDPFTGHEVSMDGLATLITQLATTPGLHVRESLGVSNA
ncbi:NAD(P)H-binding protein [Ottowia sp.]|uniref:NAD(P)H-binding protein n=1 Tax=Ottowia sp. TaxID=1898956 RepID=UPI003A87C246